MLKIYKFQGSQYRLMISQNKGQVGGVCVCVYLNGEMLA